MSGFRKRLAKVTVKEFRALRMKLGRPRVRISRTSLRWTRKPRTFILTRWGVPSSTQKARRVERVKPSTVERAAPRMPMAGKGPQPKIRMGSKIRLKTTPAIWKPMGASMLPVAWTIFWMAMWTMLGTCMKTQTDMYSMAS